MKNSIEILKRKALIARKYILKMGTKDGCFVGSALSCIDLITYIYNEVVSNLSNTNNRNYFFLSKGHAVPALYGTFVELGYLDEKRLENYNTTKDDLYLHPNANIKGVEFHSGSLGHLISVATGVAIDIKRKNKNNKVIVLLGDGELNEGSNWETLLNIAANKLDNLIIIIDRNKIQANFNTEDLIPLEPLKDKFLAFGMNVQEIDGHDFEDIDKAFINSYKVKDKANVVIAHTIRGKGIKTIENDWESWFMEYNEDIECKLLKELTINGEKEV